MCLRPLKRLPILSQRDGKPATPVEAVAPCLMREGEGWGQSEDASRSRAIAGSIRPSSFGTN
ncbi:hypothetical protein MRA01_01000 [Methylobacterium radiotolerans]|nr:hypothetical protein MRA01_01000 [Methylobacterium radiotolerans]